jgi:hypothetical protein
VPTAAASAGAAPRAVGLTPGVAHTRRSSIPALLELFARWAVRTPRRSVWYASSELPLSAWEGDISSAPVWWTFIALAAAGLVITAVALVSSTGWRRFGVGFAVGAIVALPVEAVILFLLSLAMWSE